MKYRLTFSIDPNSNDFKNYDIEAESEDEAFKIGYQMPEAKSGKYKELSLMEIPIGPSVIGVEFQYYDTVFKRNFTNYIYINAENEQQAKDFYKNNLEGKRHDGFTPSKPKEKGKAVYGKIKDTFFTGLPKYDFDATKELKKAKSIERD